MSRELPQASTLQLTDRSRQSVPQGKIEFPLSGLEPGATGSNGIQLWRGYVQYTETRRVPLWARVIAAVTCTAVVARQDLAADVPLATAQLRVETRTCPLNRAAVGARLEDVIGRVLLHSLKAGAEIPSAILEAPTVVRRGESVEVEVQSGLAVVRFDAVAQASARAGEIAELRNPINGRIFHARISAGSSPRRATALIILGKGPAL
jgi:flagella basal body P-ring formation protein FlgA